MVPRIHTRYRWIRGHVTWANLSEEDRNVTAERQREIMYYCELGAAKEMADGILKINPDSCSLFKS